MRWYEWGLSKLLIVNNQSTHRPKHNRLVEHDRRAKSTEKEWVSNVAQKLGITNNQLAEKISEYAQTNSAETFAEAFGEVHGSPTPRKEAVDIVKESGWYR